MGQLENVGKMVLTSDADAMEKLLFGLKVAVMGIGTVFSVLIFLWLVLSIFQLIFDKKASNTTPAEVAQVTTIVAPQPQISTSDDEDDTELVAVLMAAICAATGTSDSSKLRIVSYKRQKTPWNRK